MKAEEQERKGLICRERKKKEKMRKEEKMGNLYYAKTTLQTPHFIRATMDQVRLRKKLIAKRKKVAQDDFQGGCFLSFNFVPSFDLLNVIIWTSPPTSKLFKIKFSSQVALNHAILMDELKAMD